MDNRMQEEAMRRVRQMQSGNLPPHLAKQDKNPAQGTLPQEPARAEPSKPAEVQSTDPLSGLFKDKEKLLVLLLIMLLSQESTNTELVLALLYIII